MRVLYLTMNPNRASTTAPTEGWFRALRPIGLEPVLASNEVGAFHAWSIDQGVPAYHIPLPFPNKWNPLPFARSLWQLRRLVKRHGIQLVHCNEQNIYPIGQYLARLCRLPVVVSIHFTMERGFCSWAFGGHKQPDRIFFISPGNLEACMPGIEGVVSPERWRLLYNGLDLAHFSPDESLRQSFRVEYNLGNGPLIGVACALRERKQLEHLFEAAAQLPPAVKVVLAGGPVPDEKEYAQDVIRLGMATLGDRLVHVGHLDELRGLYNSLDLFINTSREEACSISVLEAMACGCPVIGYPSKSVDGQVLPGGGEIVEQDNIQKLAGAVQTWLNDPIRMEEGRRGARHRVEAEFDIRKLSLQLWNEYQEVYRVSQVHPRSRALKVGGISAC
jgi:glycosyltransferase involved in cell wall biosynthesis